MPSEVEEKSEFEHFMSGLLIIGVIVLIILVFPIGLFAAVYFGLLKRLFFN